MKTKKEILEHLNHTGYQYDDIRKISGYLLGLQLTSKGENINYKEGNETFNDFYEWVNEIPRKNKFDDIAANLDYLFGFTDGKIPENIKNKTRENVQFLKDNREYLQECMDKKEKAEAFLNDVTEILSGINKGMESFFEK